MRRASSFSSCLYHHSAVEGATNADPRQTKPQGTSPSTQPPPAPVRQTEPAETEPLQPILNGAELGPQQEFLLPVVPSPISRLSAKSGTALGTEKHTQFTSQIAPFRPGEANHPRSPWISQSRLVSGPSSPAAGARGSGASPEPPGAQRVSVARPQPALLVLKPEQHLGQAWQQTQSGRGPEPCAP